MHPAYYALFAILAVSMIAPLWMAWQAAYKLRGKR